MLILLRLLILNGVRLMLDCVLNFPQNQKKERELLTKVNKIHSRSASSEYLLLLHEVFLNFPSKNKGTVLREDGIRRI